ncbi:MAG: dihydroxyacetone kinase subunit DhaL [Chloroflexi bacterium]|nr:dihydroxyacetone kinase subunit DhaL [Chloroflexota bacterium]
MSGATSISYDDVVAWINAFAASVRAQKDYLTALDSAIGDADHGINMDRGMQAVIARLPGLPARDIGAAFKSVGMTLVSTVGGASGPLYGTFFLQFGMATVGRDSIGIDDVTEALDAAVAGIQRLGKAAAGDKTMLDALLPARDALHAAAQSGVPLEEAFARTVEAAEQGMVATTPLVARKGRASYLGERSAGHQDPGATSSYLLLKAAADTWFGPVGGGEPAG